ncbi:MAG: sulfatase-like hydrolase/transferase [Acidimicrobiia bacterium]|nr:sulfatase-like hydrolase/transferase [Acidimicrobiia bacterium]
MPTANPGPVVHDAEYYILFDQHGDAWAAEDDELDQRLADLEAQFGAKPNIVHVMWDDMAFGDAGIPALNKIRGFDTPNSNRMAAEGALYTRYYTEPACTPSRAAVITGRHAVRSGMYNVAFPIEAAGLAGEEVTMAEVLSEAGYSTAFYGKWHLGDIEESYPHNQGFDETLFTPYNQVLSLWNQFGEGANAVQGVVKEMLPDDPYEIDKTFGASDWVMTLDGKKGEEATEWGSSDPAEYNAIDPECEKRAVEFIRRNAASKTPFYAAYWPNMSSFLPSPQKETPARSLLGDGFQSVDRFLGTLMDELKELGIAENTVVVAHGDNGPMVHDPPPGLGMAETVFRGGKSDYWEGGIRVAAFAWWPGMIEAGSLVGDMIHEVDLYTTFARLAGATGNIPTDRIVDGIDQTALFLKGDTNGRRDYNFVYTGNILAATTKGRFKRVWVGDHPGLPGAAFYDLYNDPREVNPALVPFLSTSSSFTQMRKRHEIWKQKYPDRATKRGVPFTGIANARQATKDLANPPVDLDTLPFDPMEYIHHELPWDGLDPD